MSKYRRGGFKARDGYDTGRVHRAHRQEGAALAKKHCPWFPAKRREAIQDHLPERRLQPLFFHRLRLAQDSAARGQCTQAGRELAQARRLAQRYGHAYPDDSDE